MIQPTSTSGPSPEQARRNARTMATALLAGQGALLALVTWLVGGGHVAPGDEELGRALFLASVALFAVLVPLAFILRMRLLGGSGSGLPIPASRYQRAHLLFFALCEVVTLSCLATAMVEGRLIPCALVALLAIAVQVVMYPRDGT